MSYITRAQLDDYYRGISITNERIELTPASGSAADSPGAQISIFLSHSHKDSDLVQPVLAFLRSHGARICVDWMEEGMPDVVSANTAKEIDERIQRHKKVLVLVTENSKDCRWAPWELSHAGLAKGMEHIAAFPVAGNCDFSQCEYLKIYPKIYFVGNTWYVWQDDPVKITELAAWLRS